MEMTPEQLAAIQYRVKVATPPPWKADTHSHLRKGCRCGYCYDNPIGAYIENGPAAYCEDFAGGACEECEAGPLLPWADADFAAHAREDVPLLLDEVKRLRAELDVEQSAHQQTLRDRAAAFDEMYQLRVEVEKLNDQLTNERVRLHAQLTNLHTRVADERILMLGEVWAALQDLPAINAWCVATKPYYLNAPHLVLAEYLRYRFLPTEETETHG